MRSLLAIQNYQVDSKQCRRKGCISMWWQELSLKGRFRTNFIFHKVFGLPSNTDPRAKAHQRLPSGSNTQEWLWCKQFILFELWQATVVCQEWDLNPRLHLETRSPNAKEGDYLESGALDRSAILTIDCKLVRWSGSQLKKNMTSFIGSWVREVDIQCSKNLCM